MIWRCASTKWFFVYLIPGRTGIFLRRGENLSEQSGEATTNSNQILWRRSRDLVGGERSHRCAIPCYPRTPLLISAYCQLIAPKEEHVLRDGLLETLWGQ